MQKLLWTGVALFALSAPAFATDIDWRHHMPRVGDVLDVQVNVGSSLSASESLTRVTAGSVDASATSAGNVLTVDHGFAYFPSVAAVGQFNVLGTQTATTVVSEADIHGAANISTVAEGNDASLDVPTARLASVQVNAVPTQISNTIIDSAGIRGSLDVLTATVGNNLDATARSFTGAQLNFTGLQAANTIISRVSVGGNLSIETAAIGNQLSLTSGTNVRALQVNVGLAQAANTQVSDATIGGNFTSKTQAIGNSATVSIR